MEFIQVDINGNIIGGLEEKLGGQITYRKKDHIGRSQHLDYSDRLFQWDREKYNKLCKKHFGNEGQLFFARDRHPDVIEKFLSDYFDKEIILNEIIMGIRQDNGYYWWCFLYNDK